MTPLDRKRFVQLVGQVLINDGALTDLERDHLDALMDELELPAEEREDVLSEISVDSPVEERAREVAVEHHARLLAAMKRASELGGETAPSKETLIARVRAVNEHPAS